MTPPIKYSLELLKNFCYEKQVKLGKNYDNEVLFGSTKIVYHCTKCNIENNKSFTFLIKRNTLCKRCVTIESLPKQKATMLEKYGVDHPSKSQEFRNKIVNTFINKYGVDNPAKLQEIKDKQKQTNLAKYGVEYIIHNKESKEKMYKTNLEKYGTKCSLQNELVKEKVKNTNLIKYGFENVGQNLEFQEKMKNTMFEKYGVYYPLQNKEIAEKASYNSYNVKKFTFPSGNIVNYQGYEHFALKELIEKYDESDILNLKKDVPNIWYKDINNKKRRHYVDIFIPSQNKCIEVKSEWTIKTYKNNIFEKQQSAKEMGYNYEIWVYDNKGNKIDIII
jgi:hypothetical protein